jgi:hypothetical protein
VYERWLNLLFFLLPPKSRRKKYSSSRVAVVFTTILITDAGVLAEVHAMLKLIKIVSRTKEAVCI